MFLWWGGVGWLPTHYQVKLQLQLRLSWAVTIFPTLSMGVQHVLGNHTRLEILLTCKHKVLTGAVSRPFKIFWDKKYLRMVGDAGIQMPLYKRYVDDSNLVGKVPPAQN
jgi:hypothetical protein